MNASRAGGAAPTAPSDRAGCTIRFWGVRGSVPAPGPATARYGGNTPCVEIVADDGRRLVIDAGTGLVPLGRALMREPGVTRLDLLVTHGHADHVQGLPFFAPLAARRVRLALHTSAACRAGVAASAGAVLGPPLFPDGAGLIDDVTVEALAPNGAPTTVAGFAVRAVDAAHPGGAAGFRISDSDGSRALVYLSDNELATIDDTEARRTMCDAIAGAAVLIHDATYLPHELDARRGWGHSSYAEAIRLAADAGVPRLVLFHHHTDRDDDTLDRVQELAAAQGAAAGVEVTTAREGARLEV